VNLLCLILGVSTGCHAWRPIPPPSGGGFQDPYKLGDDLRIVTHDRRELHIRVAEMGADRVGGVEKRAGFVVVPFSEIQTVERSSISAVRSIGLVVAIWAGTMMVMFAAAAIAEGPRSGASTTTAH
jgi:hypothetical protein